MTLPVIKIKEIKQDGTEEDKSGPPLPKFKADEKYQPEQVEQKIRELHTKLKSAKTQEL